MALSALCRTSAARLLKTKTFYGLKRNFAAIDDDGSLHNFKTTVTILNQDQEQGIFMDSYSCLGFTLNNGLKVMGPCAVFPRSILHWNVRNVLDVDEESLSLFTSLDPKIDILILGVGERENMSKVNPAIIQHLKAKKINVELLSTDQALAVFNFLNAEKRYVAGAFIPPTYVENNEDEDYFDPSRNVPEGDPTEEHDYFENPLLDDKIKPKK